MIEKVDGLGFLWSSLLLSPKTQRKCVCVCGYAQYGQYGPIRPSNVNASSPTMDKMINESTVFSNLDQKLEPESRYIERCGLAEVEVAKQHYFVGQWGIRCLIQGIPGTLNIRDDIIIHGKDTKRHDEPVFNGLGELNGTLNQAKCDFRKELLEFFWYLGCLLPGVSSSWYLAGVSAHPQQVASVKNAWSPENVSELRGLLGTVSYCSRFIPTLPQSREG